MPIITGDISRHGVIVQTLVGVSSRRAKVLQRNSLVVPLPVTVDVAIDTGSCVTAFSPSLFRHLEIEPVARIAVGTPSSTPGNPFKCDQFDVVVTLVSGLSQVTIEDVQAISSESFASGDPVQGLIGRDVLGKCTFEYWGLDGKFRLSF